MEACIANKTAEHAEKTQRNLKGSSLRAPRILCALCGFIFESTTVRISTLASLVLLILSAVPARPQVDDPFAITKKLGDKTSGKRPATADRIDFEVTLNPKQVRRGETFRLTMKGLPKPGFHTYPLTMRADNPNQDPIQLSQLKFESTPGLKPLWPIEESPPQRVKESSLGTLLEHGDEFTWSQDILVLPDALPGPTKLNFTISLQVCDEKSCIPGDHQFSESFVITGDPVVPLSTTLKDRLNQPRPAVKVVSVSKKPPDTIPQITATENKAAPGSAKPANTNSEVAAQIKAPQSVDMGLLAFILQGILWGGISVITPCVFPMIPITVSFFLKQSEKEQHRPMTTAFVYCGTIVFVLTIAAVAFLSFFQWLSATPWLNFGVGALFIFFALSLFGMYEIELPSGLARFTSAREGKGGLVGTMFMALTFTIISFACVAPFLGGFGGTADVSQLTLLHRLLGGVAFAGTFATPFFVLALFPTLLKKMPKSGNWLNSVKVVMGFLELAAALKFLRTGELALLPQPQFLTYDFVLGLYVALSILCGLYLLNLYRLPHDTPSEHLGVMQLMFSLAFLGLGLYLMPGLFKDGTSGKSQRPSGVVFAWLDSFLLPDPSEAVAGGVEAPGRVQELPWVGTLNEGIEDALKRQRLVFVDFTGVTCTNCSLNERNVFPKPRIKELLAQYSLVQLYTDKVPNKYYSQEQQAQFGFDTSQQRADAAENLKFQHEQFNSVQRPLYVILKPLPGAKFELLARYDEGKINDESAFARFLSQPLAGIGAGARARN
jgi:thiol:disulfide interchange protein DsbD